MKTQQQAVAEFMKAAGQSVGEVPHLPSDTQLFLGVQLIAEEVEELRHAVYATKDLVQVFDALCDLIYVALWMGNATGLPIDEGFEEVHRSNMTKFIDGYRDEKTGKWRKGKSYNPPQLASIIAKQLIEQSKKEEALGPFLPGLEPQ
jgi:predicted HAD superfamily Cof-like phosphohydrolase